LSATIPVTITGFGGGTFFMDLTAPVNGNLENASAQCSITIRTLTIGSFDVAPESDRIKAGEVVNFAATWISPEGQVWRDIETLDFRIRKGNEVALWAQWEEAGNTFRVCVPSETDELTCSEAALPGSGAVLSGGAAELVMAETTVVGSGPTGLSVTLNLAVRFNEGASGNYNIELGGTDDAGKSDDLFTATKVHIENANKE
jgi:hypothetical protein